MISTKPNPLLFTDRLLTVSPGCVATNLDGETIILNIDAGVYYGLSDVGAFIWEILQQPTTFAAIHQAVLGEYAVDPQTCEADVQELINELIGQRLVAVQSVPAH
jgi:hypothetical protein